MTGLSRLKRLLTDSSDESLVRDKWRPSKSKDPYANLKRTRFRKPFFKNCLASTGLIIGLIVLAWVYLQQGEIGTVRSSHNDASQAVSVDKTLNKKSLILNPLSQRSFDSKVDSVFHHGCREVDQSQPRANAAFIVLARNSELNGVLQSIDSMERHFNQWFHYPWIFLSDTEFDDNFKAAVAQHTTSDVKFGLISPELWQFSPQTDEDFIKETIEGQGDRGVKYGKLESYHRMCRFYSGFFYKHPLVQQVDWYWRVEPDVEFFCDLTYDPFIEMEKSGKKYGFTVMVQEMSATIPNLFRYTKAYIQENNIQLPDTWWLLVNDKKFFQGRNEDYFRGVSNPRELFKKLTAKVKMDRLLANTSERPEVSELDALVKHSNRFGLPMTNGDRFDNEEWSLCHFWSNFEIARTDLFTSPEYDAYFQYLEERHGFFTERWGDAPVHSFAVAMFLSLSEVHYFRDIGYKHSTTGHCPANSLEDQLVYKPDDGYLQKMHQSAVDNWAPSSALESGVGCRCHCPRFRLAEAENSRGLCMGRWYVFTHDNLQPSRKLNLDKIETMMAEEYDQFLKANPGQGDKWSLSAGDRKRLSKQMV